MTAVLSLSRADGRATINPTAAPASLDALRRRGVRSLTLSAWVALALLVVAEWIRGLDSSPALLVLECLVNTGPSIMALQGRSDASARMTMGVVAATLPAMMVFVFRGHPWQMDAHMYFFGGLAALVILGGWRPIVLAGALTAVHHTVFEWLAPNWVFLGSGNFSRLIFHSVAPTCSTLSPSYPHRSKMGPCQSESPASILEERARAPEKTSEFRSPLLERALSVVRTRVKIS